MLRRIVYRHDIVSAYLLAADFRGAQNREAQASEELILLKVLAYRQVKLRCNYYSNWRLRVVKIKWKN